MFIYVQQEKCFVDTLSLNVMVMWLTLLLHVREVPCSSLSLETSYPDWDFYGFPRFFQANARIVPLIRP
jgi:hypothetical protein